MKRSRSLPLPHFFFAPPEPLKPVALVLLWLWRHIPGRHANVHLYQNDEDDLATHTVQCGSRHEA